MNVVDTLIERNARFAEKTFQQDLKMMPSMKTVIIGCVDPRVDPADVFQLAPGEAVVIRNVGGRIDPATPQILNILQTLAKAAGKDIGEGWNFVVLHHTDCGINGCYHKAPELLMDYLHVTRSELEELSVTDPYKAVVLDVELLKSNLQLPERALITGIVYDVKTGKIETVVPTSTIRPPRD
jgi:carbonic anhydrase